ncbi:MAG: aminotransferase class V-fold PLP-dependent enzyme [Clostridia bacterium]|nr:aminotransferase class V-fold PLP-dependent enzyme [Clostridia bacterium]
MYYFDNAATGGRKPDRVLTAVAAAMKVCANPGRSGHKLSLSCAKLVQQCRYTLDEFFDGYGYDRVVFTKNCSEALNLALFGVLKRGDHVITTCMEHNSVLRPLEFLKKSGVIEYDVCPLSGNAENGLASITPDAIRSLVRPNTRLVAITAASNVVGAIPPLEQIRAAVPKKVLFLCDGAQGAGHFPIKMKGAGIDLLTIAGHKGMHGIQGSGVLLFSSRVEPTPLLYGGTGSMSVSLDMPDFYPDALEAGTLSFPAVVSLLEGARYCETRLDETAETCQTLSEYFLTRLSHIPPYVAYSKPNPCGIAAFRHPNLSSEHLAEILSSRYDIAVRGGLHCAPLIHEALGTLDDGLVRASFSAFNSTAEIDVLLSALTELSRT